MQKKSQIYATKKAVNPLKIHSPLFTHEFPLYVEINENKCEGLVPIRDLEDDYYEFDEKNYCLMGRRKHRIYRLGDPIRIKVARANLERKQLDFALVE